MVRYECIDLLLLIGMMMMMMMMLMHFFGADSTHEFDNFGC